jgi:hypothetical protein
MGAMRSIMVLGGIMLAGCGGEKAGDQTGTGQGRDGMAGMNMDSGGRDGHMDMDGMNMMRMMQEHMDSMMRMSPAQMSQMMAMHGGMMSQMMDRMGGDMRGMKMEGNAEWTALGDSVKRDLADLPGLQGKDLSARMTAHGDRVRRLLTMHENMMKGM